MDGICIGNIYDTEMYYLKELRPRFVIVKSLDLYQYFDIVDMDKFNIVSDSNPYVSRDKTNLVLLKDFNENFDMVTAFVGINGMENNEIEFIFNVLKKKELREISSDYEINKRQKVIEMKSNVRTTHLIDELGDKYYSIFLGTNSYWYEQEQNVFYEVYLNLSFSMKEVVEEESITMTNIKKGYLSYLSYYIGNLLWNEKNRHFIYDKSDLYFEKPYPVKCQSSYEHYYEDNDKYDAFYVGETIEYNIIGIRLYKVDNSFNRNMYNSFTPRECFLSKYKFKYGPNAEETNKNL